MAKNLNNDDDIFENNNDEPQDGEDLDNYYNEDDEDEENEAESQGKYKNVAIIAAVTIIVILGCIFILPKFFGKARDTSNAEDSSKINMSVDGLYISRYFDTSADTKHDFQVKLTNSSEEEVLTQLVITIWGKAIADIESAGISAEDYVSSEYFKIFDTDMNNVYTDKYYILESSESIRASEYGNDNGSIIGVRYFIPLNNWPVPANGKETQIKDFIFYIDKSAPDYYYSNIEITTSVKVQCKLREKADWLTASQNQIYSNSFDGEPLSLNPTNTITPEPPEFNDPYFYPGGSDNPNSDGPENPLDPDYNYNPDAPEIIDPNGYDTTDPVNNQTETIFPQSMSMNTGSLSLSQGETALLTITFDPVDTTETSIMWASDNTDVATVNGGSVIAVAPGTANISATSVNGMVLNCTVIVAGGASENTPADDNSVKAITFNAYGLEMIVGSTFTLQIGVDPVTITSLSATWSTSDSNVATIGNDGTITAIGPGSATITLTAENGVSASCLVNVS